VPLGYNMGSQGSFTPTHWDPVIGKGHRVFLWVYGSNRPARISHRTNDAVFLIPRVLYISLR
jgi:hypothetical protein